MSLPKWITPSKNLGSFPENEYFEYQLEAQGTGPLSYKLISGELPPGMYIDRQGKIQGVPIITNAGFSAARLTSDFTVRVTNGLGRIADRSFSISINGLVPPSIIPDGGHLGTYFDGTYLDIQLTAVDPNPEIPLIWSFDSGEMPIGVKLTSDGKLQGYLYQYRVPSSLGSNNWDRLRWDEYLWDFSDTPQNHTYEFTVTVFDGLHKDKAKYTLTVISRSTFTADNDALTADTELMTVDADTRHLPIIVTDQSELPETRQLSEYAFKFTAFDFDSDAVYYYIDTSEPGMSLPPGLSLDPETGWLTGSLGPQAEDEKIYTFNVYAVKRYYPSFVGEPRTFQLKVFGSVDNYIEWITPSDLGFVENGMPSQLRIQATHLQGKIVQFRIKPGSRSRLPQGLKFQDVYFWNPLSVNYQPGSVVIWQEQYYRAKLEINQSGLEPDSNLDKWELIDYSEILPGIITGRPSISHFTLDRGATTIDKNRTSWDNTYTFTVEAYTIDDSKRSTKTFTVRVINRNERPFENLYLKALLSREERKIFQDIVNNTDLFPNELMYRINDPWFGKAKDIKFLFLPGLDPTFINDYIAAMQNNHYNKYIEMGEVRTAVAVDEFRRPIYEVVYVEVKDTLSENGKNPKQSLDLSKINQNPWHDEKGNMYRILEPNGFDNMKFAVESSLGRSNKGVLPEWMTSVQPDGRVLGFINAVVLAYTVPGASKLIAYRLRNNGIVFKNLNFVVDRYQLDNVLSKFYDIEEDRFIDSQLTTFDRLPSISSTYRFAESISYAITKPFASLYNRYKFDINQEGGISGRTNYVNGELVVFVKQENYPDYTGENHGWFITHESFDSEPYDSLTFSETEYIPGYWESLASSFTRTVTSFASSGSTSLHLNFIADIEIGSRIQADEIDRAAYVVGISGSSIILDRPIFDNISPGTEITVTPVLNKQGGVWRIKIDPSTTRVTFEFVKEVFANEWILINKGVDFVDTKMYYDIVIKPDNTKPEYSLFETKPGQETIFDGGATRFYDSRDQYTLPGQEDKYLKFPKLGVFK